MNEQVASLYAEIGVKISGALRQLRDFRSRLVSSQSALKTLRDQSKITSAAINIGLTAALVAVGSKAITAFGSAETAMNVFKLATHATSEEMAAAQAAVALLARDLSLPGVTGRDAAEALAALGNAGLSARDAIDALRPSLLLAQAGEMKGAEAADILAAALTAFSLPGTEAARVVDLLAGAASAATGSVIDHADALRRAGPVWALAGVPIEDLVTSIALLAKNGIVGATSGEQLKNMMLRLIAPTEEANAMIRAMGISIYDSQGNMRDWRDIIAQFQRGLAPLTEAQRNQRLETIFGSEAVSAAAIIFQKEGVPGLDAMKKAVTETGTAQALAQAKTEGLGGAIGGLGKAADTASENAIKPFAQDIALVAKTLANTILWLDSFDDTTKRWVVGVFGAILAIGGLAIVIGGVASVISTVITFVLSAWGWFAALAAGAEALGGVLALLVSGPIGWTILTIAALAAGLVIAYNNVDWFRHIVDTAFATAKSAISSMWSTAQPILSQLVEWVQRGIDALNRLAGTRVTIPSIASNIPIVGGVVGAVGAIGDIWNGLTPAPRTVTIGGPASQQRARGGSVAGNTPYMVGERGPELFTPGRSGGITPNGGGAGGGDIHVHLEGAMISSSSEFEEMVVRTLSRARAAGRM